MNRMYIRNIPIHWSGSDLARWVTRECQCRYPTNTFVNPRTDRDQDMASGLVTWHCTTDEFQRYLIACSNHLLVTDRSDRPTIAKRADDRPGPKQWTGYGRYHSGVTGQGYGYRQSGVTSSGATGSADASGSGRWVRQGGAKREAPDVSWLHSRFGVTVLKTLGVTLDVS